MKNHVLTKLLSKCFYMAEAVKDNRLDFIKNELNIDNARLGIWIKWRGESDYLLNDFEQKLERAVVADPIKYLGMIRSALIDLESDSNYCNMWITKGRGIIIVNEINRNILNTGKICLEQPESWNEWII